MSEESPLPKIQTEFSNRIKFASLPAENCKLNSVLNRIAHSDILATLDSPPFPRAIVEGYLVNTEDTKKAEETAAVSFNIVGEILPGDDKTMSPKAGEAIQISTGSLIPDGNFSCIRMWEAKKNDNKILVSRPFPPRFFIEEQGCDSKVNDILVPAGTKISAMHIGTLASMGIQEISVTKQARVAIFSSGDEVIPYTDKFKLGHIFDCNLPMLSAAVEDAGGIAVPCGIQSDNFEQFVSAAKEALLTADMILISGGTAVGGRNFISDLVSELGELIVDGVQMRSGRPLIMGIADEKPIVCVAGYPPEALRGFTLFGSLALNMMSGFSKELPSD